MPEKGKLWHRVNRLYPDFYMDYVEVGRYVRLVHLGPTYDGAIGKVVEIKTYNNPGLELYSVQFQYGEEISTSGGHIVIAANNIELLPADYEYRTQHEKAIEVLGEDYFA